MTSQQSTKFLLLSGKRGQELAAHVQALLLLDVSVAVEINALLLATLAFAQGYAKAMVHAFSWVMKNAGFSALPLRTQAAYGEHAYLWEDLFSGIGAAAYQKRLSPHGLFVATPAQQFFPASERGLAVVVRLEEVIDSANRSGVSFSLFWTSTLNARLALGRLALLDVVLDANPDFDPLAEAMRMLREAIPLSPDVVPLAKRLNIGQPTGLLVQKASRAIAYTVRQGDTMELIAQRTLGNAARWRELADFNRLRYPFISDDSAYALGPKLLTALLTAPTVIGATIMTFEDVTGIQVGMRMHVSWNQLAQIFTVLSVNSALNVITFSEECATIFPITACVSAHSSVLDTRGVVLTSGSSLLIPISALAEGGASIQEGASTVTAARLYGTDMLEQGNDLVIENGDFTLVSGWENLRQALQHRFLVELGSLAYHPDYGTGLLAYIGLRNAPYFQFLAATEARQTVLRDPRIAQVNKVTGEVKPDRLDFDVTVTTAAFEQFPPLQLTVVI